MPYNQKASPFQKKNRFIYFQFGLVIAIGVVITAFSWRFDYELPHKVGIDDPFEDAVFEIMPPVMIEKKLEELPKTRVDMAKVTYEVRIVTTDPDPILVPQKTLVIKNEVMPDPPKEIEVDNEPIDFPEVKPKFPGGEEALYRFIKSNYRISSIDRKDGVKGRIVVEFVVDKNGKVQEVKILKGINKRLDMEALRLVNQMPLWTPGFKNGKVVNVRFRLPINVAVI